jgi:hypothetical protein
MVVVMVVDTHRLSASDLVDLLGKWPDCDG